MARHRALLLAVFAVLTINPRRALSGQRALESPDWVKNAVIYEVYLRAFSPEGKLHAVEARLNELKSLGVTCLYIMPVHPAGQLKKKGSLGSPYAVKDYYGVGLEYGTKDGFKSLVSEAHLAGMKVIIDWVANHTAWDNALLKSNPEWFLKDAKTEIAPPNDEWTDTAGLDYASAGLRKYMREAMAFWVREFDVDGFRCDVADLVPLDFWEDVRRDLTRIKKDVLLIAEGSRPENHLKAFNLTYSDDYYDLIAAIARGQSDAAQIEPFLEKEAALYPEGALQLRYTENHDKQRAAQYLGPAHEPAAVLIFSLDGVPLVYNGQEIGETLNPSLFEKEEIDWAGGYKKNSKLRKFYKKLMRFRASHPSLSRGQRFPVSTSGPRSVFAFARSYREDAVLVAVNLSPAEFNGTIEVPEIFRSEKGKLRLKALFPPDTVRLDAQGRATLRLPAWGYQVWEMK